MCGVCVTACVSAGMRACMLVSVLVVGVVLIMARNRKSMYSSAIKDKATFKPDSKLICSAGQLTVSISTRQYLYGYL